jgi:hypothetical protein
MDENIPWTGGISNRQIFIDTTRGLTVWLAIAFSLAVLFWWLANDMHLTSPIWRGPVCGALAGVLGSPIARWCRS